jgi:nucleotide-binding universal stress UspA family protein
MMKKILVALDGSENAEKALSWVRSTARREKAQVHLVRVASLEEFGREYVHVELRFAHDYLQGLAAKLNAAGIPCTFTARVGDPARLIVRTAEAQGCGMILMTTRGGSTIRRWAIGGVTEKVLRLSPVPVLVIRGRAVRRIRRILVPVDGSTLAETAVPWTARLAKLLGAKLVFVHVYPAGPVGLRTWHQEKFEAIDRRMTRLCLDLAKKGVKASFNVQSGDPADRILAFAVPNDLIVTTTHGAGGFKRWVFGSVAEKLIHEASIPVLVYKSPAAAAGAARRPA